MGRADKNTKTKAKGISVWNWVGTIALCSIPGVNIIAMILWIIFARTQSKRNYAIAGLVLMGIVAVLICAAFMIFPEALSQFAAWLRGGDAVTLLIQPAG